MSRAEEQALKAYPKATRDIGGIVVDIGHPQYMRDLYIEGYNQAEQDLMDKAKQWFTEYVSVHFELETNEDGEPLADSYIQYAKAKLDAANETFENFKQFITEN